ncbi:MAG: T9SS type A sorting domain-containing protein [Flavobacteriaceae bacterium]|nr:T9SS type A sorting domain-containing protein [Flavobacteriaceae bacterium]
MKTIILFFVFSLSLYTQAQFTIQSGSTVITSGHVFTYNTIDYPASKLALTITNNSTETKQYLIKVEDLINTTGDVFQVCINVCYIDIEIGNTYPLRSDNVDVILTAGASTANNQIYLLNMDTGNGTFPMDHVFRIYEVDSEGNEIGTPFFFTYRYDPGAIISIEESFNHSTSVFPTYSHDLIYVQAQERVKSSVFDLQGRMLLSNSFQSDPTIDLSSFANQVYILVVENEKGEKFTQKVFKI